MKGDQIPLAARIFAVIDVWDALISDRPYRPAWPNEDALDYIREQSNKHFDPQVAETFLNLINGMKGEDLVKQGVLTFENSDSSDSL